MLLLHDLAIIGSGQIRISSRFDCHVYALRGPGGLVVIDSGSGLDTQSLFASLQADLGLEVPKAVILTHCHADHSRGAAAFRRQTGCTIVAPEPSSRILESGDEEASGLRVARERGLYPADLRLEPCPIDLAVKDGEVFEVSGLTFRALHIRGHSPDSYCFMTEVNGLKALFSGDVIFYGGLLGLINFEGSEMAGYRSDLPKLSGLSVEALLPGHGLFTIREGQRHIDCAIEQLNKGFIPRQIGQGDLIF